MRYSNFQSLGDVIQQWKASNGVSERLKNAQVVSQWHQMISSVWGGSATRSAYFRDGVLYVRLSSAALRQELFFVKEKIKNNINNELKENYLQDIVLG